MCDVGGRAAVGGDTDNDVEGVEFLDRAVLAVDGHLDGGSEPASSKVGRRWS